MKPAPGTSTSRRHAEPPEQLIRLSRSLKKATKDMRYARAEVEKLAEETEIFGDTYCDFMKAYSPDRPNNEHASSSTQHLKIWTKDAIRRLKKLLRRVQALNEDSGYLSFDAWKTRHRWSLIESAVKCLRASLDVAKESINCFRNIRTIEHLCELLTKLETAATVERRHKVEVKHGVDFERAQDELKYRRRQRHKIDKRIQRAKEQVRLQSQHVTDGDLVPPMDKLFKLADSVQDYAEHVLPMEQAGRRPRASLRPTSIKTSSGSLVCSSRSTTTASRESTQASDNGDAAPESPPTFPASIPTFPESPPTFPESPPTFRESPPIFLEPHEEDFSGQVPRKEVSPVESPNYCIDTFPEPHKEDFSGQVPLNEISPVESLNYYTDSSSSSTRVGAHKTSITVPVLETSPGSQPSRKVTSAPLYHQRGVEVSETILPKPPSRSMTPVLRPIRHKRESYQISHARGTTMTRVIPVKDEVKLDSEICDQEEEEVELGSDICEQEEEEEEEVKLDSDICEQEEEESKDDNHTNDDLRRREYPAALLSRPVPLVRGQFPPTWRKRR